MGRWQARLYGLQPADDMVQHGASRGSVWIGLDRNARQGQALGQWRWRQRTLFDQFDDQALEHGQQHGMRLVVLMVPRLEHRTENVA